ncbi:DNA glycosylase [Halteromyces radiatus]|uniref:DNA glycosylase n=1 Tax=Halteromyces radiatus TaxID=101107 RepID=UPI0022207B88|nr:DNA glycosylase [Halteromyces radiatus]KAI8097117.1 DNA glycosylase [Halteromyces radiatus]
MKLRSARIASTTVNSIAKSSSTATTTPERQRGKRKHVTSSLSIPSSSTRRSKVKKEQEDDTTTTMENVQTIVTTSTTSVKKKPTKNAKKQHGAPLDWNDTFTKIKEYRQHHSAVVDTMGCERLAQRDVPAKQQRFQTLVALMLSSQTKDTVTSAAVKSLQADLPGGLSLQSILTVDESTLDYYIRSVGFHTKKAAYIKKAAIILQDQYDGDIPDTIEGLTALPGVGPKMGYLALQCAWQKNVGIGVDVHVHRIANRLGWCHTEKGGPEDTRLSLQSWLPKEHWREINPMLVGFGQIVCLPRGPRCGECPVVESCPSASIKVTKLNRSQHQAVIKKQETQDGQDTIALDIKQAEDEIKAESIYFIKSEDDVGNKLIKKEDLDW